MSEVVQALDIRRITYTVFQRQDEKREKLGKAVALTSANPGEGVTYVSRLLCVELAGDRSGRALYCTLPDLAATDIANGNDVEKYCKRTVEGYWVMNSQRLNSEGRSNWDFNVLTRQARIEAIRSRFEYAILDCEAVSGSGEVAGIASLVDGMLLVVAAGGSTSKQIMYAQKMIASSGGSLEGLVMNRRTYPIPNWIFQMLRGATK
jgi:Mrp family chromosome partitioning ATPase